MDRIKRLLVLFKQEFERLLQILHMRRPNALENSSLAVLPIELLHEIVHFLPVASAASFSLSCRHLHLLLGTQYISHLKASSLELSKFLELLERDFPDQISCNSCRKLHKIQDAWKYTEMGFELWVNSHGLEGAFTDCLSKDMLALVTPYTLENFSTTVFKMTVKHYRNFGLDTESRRLLALLAENSFALHRSRNVAILTEEAECRITDSSLYMCKHVSFQFTDLSLPQILKICPHLELSSESSDHLCIATSFRLPYKRTWEILLGSRGSQNTNMKNSSDFCTELQQCQYCRTEYQVYSKQDEGGTTDYRITVWKDFGHGPESHQFKSHIPVHDIDWRLLPPIPKFPSGQIVSAFEEKEFADERE